jgi:head-tail adaptor
MSGLLNTTVTRLRPAMIIDAYGNTVPDWTAADTVAIPARVQQSAQQEDTADRDQQSATFVVFLPAGADVTGSDRLDWSGRTLELLGPPAQVDAYSRPHHVEARAREVIG